MVKYLSNKTFSYLIRSKAITTEDSYECEWIRYGIEISISSIIGFSIIIMMSLVIRNITSGLLFLFVFVPIRQYVGGYHAETYLKCNLTFSISYLIVLLCCKYTCNLVPLELCIFLSLIELILILKLAPIRNRHKPIKSKRQYIKCKVIGTIMFSGYSSLSFILMDNNRSLATMILYTLHLVMVLGIVGYFKERSYTDEKETAK